MTKTTAQLDAEIGLTPKSRAQLVRVAHTEAASIFVRAKKSITPAMMSKAKAQAFRAIAIEDPRAGTADHPHAPYSHGIAALAEEGVQEAVAGWLRIQKQGIRR